MDGDDELHAVGHHERHAIAGLHPPTGQVAGQRVAQALQFVERPVLVAAPDGISISESVRGAFQGFMHQHRFHWKHSSPI